MIDLILIVVDVDMMIFLLNRVKSYFSSQTVYYILVCIWFVC
jgi:hypothetical protein